jgi:hypothetical protein
MVQVEELLGMFDRSRLDRPTVAQNFKTRWVQPCKKRVHPLYEYSGSDDPTRESTRHRTSDEVDWWLAQLFDMAAYQGLAQAMPSYRLSAPPPQVKSACPHLY